MLWFSGLGFGARLLRGLFAKPLAWRMLDVLIAAVMITLGVLLFIRIETEPPGQHYCRAKSRPGVTVWARG